MYDTRAKHSISGQPMSAAASRDNRVGPQIAAPEAELLRVISRALDEQRTNQLRAAEASMPLVSRIETILGTRLEAANDVYNVFQPQSVEAPIVAERGNVRPASFEPSQLHHRQPTSRPRRYKYAAAAATMCAIGAMIGALIPLAPTLYTAETVLKVQPGAGTAAAVATAVRTLSSARAIAAAVSTLKLDRDPEFAGSSSNTIGIALDLLSASGAASDPASRAEASLSSAIETSSDGRSGTVDFKVTTRGAAKSARIAAFLASKLTSQAPATARMISDDLAIKKANDEAQNELSAFTSKSGEGNVKVAIDLQGQITQLDTDINAADQQILDAKMKADRLKSAKLADVTNGSLPTEMMSPALQDWRDKYVTAKISLAQLSAQLGPRHPRLLAQQVEADGLRDNLTKELANLLQEANVGAKSAVASRKQLNDRRNALIAQSRDTGVDLAKLTELHDKAEVAKSRLNDAISTGSLPAAGSQITLQKPPQVSAVSAATASWSRALLGGAVGLGLGILTAIYLRMRRKPVAVLPDISFAEELMAEMEPEPEEVDILRSEIASLRNRLHAYGADRRAS
jgi:uncharacterized protein involved in exopolysaccharide biosynthesis